MKHLPSLIDTHCHLDFDRFDQDRQTVVERAVEQGIGAIINPGVDLESSRAAVALAEAYSAVYAAVGVHPTSTHELDESAFDELGKLARHPKVVAIGEIGLDYYWPRQSNRNWTCAAPETQRVAFERQLQLAAEMNLPVIVHDREAHADVIAVLEKAQSETVELGQSLKGVLHSFSGDLNLAQQVVDIGFYVGITGPVTFKKSYDMQQVAQHVHWHHVLIETDAPFLTPHPYRGRRNEPAYVRFVAEKIAELRGVDSTDVIKRTWENTQSLFQRLQLGSP